MVTYTLQNMSQFAGLISSICESRGDLLKEVFQWDDSHYVGVGYPHGTHAGLDEPDEVLHIYVDGAGVGKMYFDDEPASFCISEWDAEALCRKAVM